jgi:thymidylate synthase (FAD)
MSSAHEIRVHDHGYVRLVTYMPANMVAIEEAITAGDLDGARAFLGQHDLAAVNAARASFATEKAALDDRDRGLIRFLADAAPVPHSSPFRHNHVTLEVNCPLIVARQWWRHVIGGSTTEEGTPWSELSRRYVRGGIQYHVPERFRVKPANAKQGSGGPAPDVVNAMAQGQFRFACETAVEIYEYLLNDLSIAPEQARMVLPQGVYTSFRWSPSVQTLANFLVQREDSHAQEEIRDYAAAVRDLVARIFPLGIAAMAPPQ